MSKRQYSTKLPEALQYAAELHASQKRKGKNGAPYLGHLLGVCSMVLENRGGEDLAIVAVLHDAIEDRPNEGRTLEDIKLRFGDKILNTILELTHEPYDGFVPQKELTDKYCAHLWKMSDGALLIALADKIYNAESVVWDLETVGIGAFDAFKGGRDSVTYKYEMICNTIAEIVAKKQLTHMTLLVNRFREASSIINLKAMKSEALGA